MGSVMYAPRFTIKHLVSKHLASSSGFSLPAINTLALVMLTTLGADSARADRIKAFAVPPVFLWTGESPSVAQRVTTSIADDFGTIHTFGSGTFIGGTTSPKTSIDISAFDKNGKVFSSVEAVHSTSSSSNYSSSPAGTGSSLGVPLSSVANAGAALAAVSMLGLTSGSDDPNSVPLIRNPIPTAIVLFASGL